MTTVSPNPTGLDSLLERVGAALSNDLLPVEIFNNDEVFKAEMEKIYGKCWVFVAHETEIPKAGDFVQRRIGIDPVIVTRDGKGGINVLSNYCRHRGTQVCQTDGGNSRFFKCSYHGWTYGIDGDLLGTPHLQDAYGKPVDRREWGLFRAPRVDTRHGFIFASLAEHGPSLDEYLGGAGWMLDLLVGLAPGGMRVAGPPERYKLRADWKTAAENFVGDTYHVDNLHTSVEEIGVAPSLDVVAGEIGRYYEFENGHGFVGHAWGEVYPGHVLWGYPPEITEKFDLSGLDETQLKVLHEAPITVGTIFPNLSFLRSPSAPYAGAPLTVGTSFRQWQPLGPGEFELWNWQFVWDFQPEEEAMEYYMNQQFTFGSAGIYEADDTVAWEGAPKAAHSPWMLKEGAQFNFQQGNNSAVDQTPDPSWKGPGLKRNSSYGEHNQLAFYRHWFEVMSGGAAPARSEGN